MAAKHSKRFTQCLEKVPKTAVPLSEAVGILKDLSQTKFDATVELVMLLGIDTRHADKQIRGSLSLPNGIGSKRKVIAFCEGEDIEAAKNSGAIEAGGDDLVEKIQNGWMEFDVALARRR